MPIRDSRCEKGYCMKRYCYDNFNGIEARCTSVLNFFLACAQLHRSLIRRLKEILYDIKYTWVCMM